MNYLQEHYTEIFKKYTKEEIIKDIEKYKYEDGSLQKTLNQFFEETIFKFCEYLNYIKSDTPVLGILVGMDSTKNIAKNTTYKYYNIIKSEYKYQDKIKHEFLNPTYEAKCVPYLKENDTLYVVA